MFGKIRTMCTIKGKKFDEFGVLYDCQTSKKIFQEMCSKFSRNLWLATEQLNESNGKSHSVAVDVFHMTDFISNECHVS